MPRERKPWTPFGPIAAGLVALAGHPWNPGPMRAQSSPSVIVPVRTLRVIEAQIQTARARVVEAEVVYSDHAMHHTPSPHNEDLWEALGVADDTLKSVLALISEVSPPPGG